MNMKLKSFCLVVVILLTAVGMNAKSTTFLQDGRTFPGTIIDMSSRTGMVEYWGNTKLYRKNIWMINFPGNISINTPVATPKQRCLFITLSVPSTL